MCQAVASGREIDIDSVLELCNWVIGRPAAERTTPESEDDVLVDMDWEWTRNEIARLVSNACKASSEHGPKFTLDKYREPFWTLLEPICQDRAESYIVRHADKEDPRLQDYLTHGINSPRGKAFEAALEYARWIANHAKEITNEHEVIPGGFDAMPEVRKMLEWQMGKENRSLEVMSVIGSRIGLINWIDSKWLAENAELLFDLHGIERDPSEICGWAAWNAFLVWLRPHIDFYRMFKSQYAYAVEHAVQVELSDHSNEDPMIHLGRHLVVLYGRGQLALDEDDGLIRKFVTQSHPEIRRQTMGFVGQSFGDSETVPKEIVERFITLWELYWSDVGEQDAAEKPGTWLFGPWFVCGRFPDDWAMEQLEQFAKVSPIVEPDHDVVERLAELAGTNPERAAIILEHMVKGDREGWRVYGWMEDARRVLEAAMSAEGEARKFAERVIDYLGRRGYTQLGDLLD